MTRLDTNHYTTKESCSCLPLQHCCIHKPSCTGTPLGSKLCLVLSLIPEDGAHPRSLDSWEQGKPIQQPSPESCNLHSYAWPTQAGTLGNLPGVRTQDIRSLECSARIQRSLANLLVKAVPDLTPFLSSLVFLLNLHYFALASRLPLYSSIQDQEDVALHGGGSKWRVGDNLARL